MKAEADKLVAREPNAVIRFVRGWDKFFFSPADPTTLGVIRICAGLVMLYMHCAYTYDFQEFFGRHGWMSVEGANLSRKEAPWPKVEHSWDPSTEVLRPLDPERDKADFEYAQRWGFHPDQTHAKGNYWWSVYYHIADPPWNITVHFVFLIVMALFTLGFCTRVTSVLSWIAAISYIYRSPMTVFGVDTIMIVLLLYLMIGPSGAALSLDRLIAYYWKVWRARSRGEPTPPWQPPQPMVSAGLAYRLMQIHFCFIYLASGLSKLQGQTWWNGTAIHYTVANYEFSLLRFELFSQGFRWLCSVRWLWEVTITGGTYFTLFLEIGLPFMIWNRRLRWLMICGAMMLHMGIAMSMGLVTFSLMMMTLALAFVPPETVQRLLASLGIGALMTSRGPKIAVAIQDLLNKLRRRQMVSPGLLTKSEPALLPPVPQPIEKDLAITAKKRHSKRK